ncbi:MULTISPECIES: LuxR C-terminal-related transcriptional regulator [unclassified Mycobacterium]|uniref:LuxR C-terminal-related transcriptional regulator n=1 Tax=unclassified Mycobacterium TaxID=2642494 RepID=UPI0008950259|nr:MULTISPECIES: LuxR C-terminal-related transcriptional regulator [unclassified Mycobacterium]SEA59936.1 GAF domain-containing protein [Mycobacterium sp. 283mftsu]
MKGTAVNAQHQRARTITGRAITAITAAHRELDAAVELPNGELDDAVVEQLVDDTLNLLRDALAERQPSDDVGGLALRAFELSEIRQEMVTGTLDRRLNGLSNVQLALGKLRAVRSTDEMMARAPRTLCEQCGFKIATLMRVDEGGRVLPVSGFHAEKPDWEQTFKDIMLNSMPVHLDASLIETEMVRRRSALIVHDAYNDPRVTSEHLRMAGAPSYVAAPIMPEGRVIGFLHASHGSTVDIVDRDILWAFAEGYGYALERTILVERLYEHGERMRELMRSTDAVLEQLREADLQIISAYGGELSTARVPRVATFAAPLSAIHELLTRREIEIIELMAHGDTNKQIADRLIVSEGTVKAHVRQVLRKLKAANRAEAVSQYTRMLHGRS